MSGQLKEVRGRITSVKSTQQITKAMKMVSAAKLRKAQNAITEMRPYADRLNKILKNILSNSEGDGSSSFGVERDIVNACVVIITSDRGLCGAYNTNILKATTRTIEGPYAEAKAQGNLHLLPIGKKALEFCKRRYPESKIIEDHANLNLDLNFDAIAEVANQMMGEYAEGNLDHITVCYSKFKNAALQEPIAVQYLPVEKIAPEVANDKTTKAAKADYIFEPDQATLLEQLIPSILQTSMQKYLFDNRACEHGARMTAMDKATENAEDLINDLKIFYNKARQESITKELSEIVAGAAALGG